MKNRLALSSVVGTVFSIIALGTTIGYITYSMNVLENFNTDTIVRNVQSFDSNQEGFEVVKASLTNSKFNITVQNTGNIPINITRLWIKNTTATNWVYKYDLNAQVSPGGTTKNIGYNLPLTAKVDKSYDVKLITQRGNVNEFLINSPYSNPLDLRLYAVPTTVPDGYTTTLILTVTNNMSSKNTLLNITPITDLSESGIASAVKISGPIPSSYESLKSGDTASFRYTYTMSGTTGDSKTFTGSLVNGFPGNTDSADITLQDIAFSIQSGSSLESQGLSTNVVPPNVLVFHQESTDALSQHQMFAGAAENPTTWDTSSTQSWIFYTRNDTLSDVNVDAGKWNATLRMISKSIPDTNPAISSLPKLIYLFNETAASSTAADSSGNSRTMTLGTSTAKPAASTSYGMNGTVGYHFDGGDYMEGPTFVAGTDDVGLYPDTTTGWFKTSSTSDTKQVIYRIGTGSEYYEIAMADGNANSRGKVFFKYAPTGTGTPPQGSCSTSLKLYNDGNWHHFAAVRDNQWTCKLYMDGVQDGSDTTNTCTGCTGTNTDQVQPAAGSKVTIGRDPSTSSNYFTGDLDQIFHWNDAQLSQNQVNALKKANYGANAHAFNFILERTNAAGTTVYETLKSDTAYLISFYDGKGGSAISDYSKLQRNYTTGALGTKVFTAIGANHDSLYGDRLRLTITRNTATSLNMTIKIDETSMATPPSSFLQTPHTDEPWPSYWVYKISGALPQVYVYNQGPYGSWITTLTRLTWDDIASVNSYGSYVDTACGVNINILTGNTHADSPLIKVGDQCLLIFTKPSDPPYNGGSSPPSGTVTIPAGLYRVNVFMSGYDEGGKIFLRTTYIGIIRAIP